MRNAFVLIRARLPRAERVGAGQRDAFAVGARRDAAGRSRGGREHHHPHDGGLTQVSNAFYRGTLPRVYVDSAPHTVANGALTYATPSGFTAALGYRHTSGYRPDGLDATLRASGLDVLDFSMKQRVRRWLDFNAAIDNLTNKHYFETQNFFASRLRPTDPAIARIHGTPGYPFGLTLGLTFKLFGKE